MRPWSLIVRVAAATLVASSLVYVAAAPQVAHSATGIVRLQDADHLGVDGQLWRLKAVQFWMTDYVSGPPEGWFNTWLVPQDATYMEQARWEIASLAKANLGANTLRVFFPFALVTDRQGNFQPEAGNASRTTLDHLDVFLRLADEQGMKVVIVLFGPNACGVITGCWSPAQERFVVAMAQHLRGRSTLAYWSTVNEINDHDWGVNLAQNPSNRDMRLDWNWRIASTLRAQDPTHLVSTSVQTDAGDGTASRYHDYFAPVSWNPNGILAGMVDFLTPHTFLGVTGPNQDMVNGLRAGAPGKPIAFEEIGWPTGPTFSQPQFTDAVQQSAVMEILCAATAEGIAGVGVWMLIDFNGVPDEGNREQGYFGLFWSTYTATHSPGAAGTPSPWSRKPAADAVQRQFTSIWPG